MKKWGYRLFCYIISLCFLTLFVTAAEAHVPPTVSEVETIYAIDCTQQTYHSIPSAQWETVRKALTLPIQAATGDAAAKDRAGFCIITKDGTRTYYTVTEKQVIWNNQPLTASAMARGQIEKLCADLCATNPAEPALFAAMPVSSVQMVTITGYGATGASVDPAKPIKFSAAAKSTTAIQKNRAESAVRLMKSIRVAPNTTKQLPTPTNLDLHVSALQITLALDTKATYTCTVTPQFVTISSSDGIYAYRYEFAGYKASGTGDGWRFLQSITDLYINSTSYSNAAIFQTTAKTGAYSGGTFYLSGTSEAATVSNILESIFAMPYQNTVAPISDTFITVYVTERTTGRTHKILFDSSYNAYFEDRTGTPRTVSVGQTNWRTIRDMQNGERQTDKLMLLEKDSGEARLLPLTGKESFLAPLFSPLPKDPAQKAYNTGEKPDYTKNGITCLRNLGNGQMIETTVYQTALVQQSNRLPWTPATYDSAMLYTLLDNYFYD